MTFYRDGLSLPLDHKLILSLCDYSGVWSRPYAEAGYNVLMVDIQHERGVARYRNRAYIGHDLLKYDIYGIGEFATLAHGILAAPPCTVFCRPGARYWAKWDREGRTEKEIELFRKVLALCRLSRGWWALENPPGRHQKLIAELGAPAWQYQPFWYGDPWGKQTYIWGTARKPEPTKIVAVPPTTRAPSGHTQGVIARKSSSAKADRERTPEGFARAFFAVNP